MEIILQIKGPKGLFSGDYHPESRHQLTVPPVYCTEIEHLRLGSFNGSFKKCHNLALYM